MRNDDEFTDPATNEQIISDRNPGRPAPEGLEQCPMFDSSRAAASGFEELLRTALGDRHELAIGDGLKIEPGLGGRFHVTKNGRDVPLDELSAEDLAAIEAAAGERK